MKKLGLIFGIWCSFISSIYPSAGILAAPGDPDPSFGGDGSVTLNLSPEGFSNCPFQFVAPTRDGKIMAAGSCWRDSLWYLLAARYNGDGTLDATFNGRGYLLASMESLNFHNRAIAGRRAIALQGDGKLIVVSTTGPSFGPTRHFAVRRFNADGSVDADFGTSRGMSAIFFGSSADASAVALLEDGRILVAGAVRFPSDSDSERVRFGFALFHPNGTLDHSFGASDGTSFATYGDYEYLADSPARVIDMAVIGDGKILFSGCGNHNQCVVARLESSGEEDSTFRAFRITQREPRNPAILPKSDGSVYLFTDAGVMRLKPDGALDWSWFFSFDSTGEGALAMQTSGKLLFGRFSFPIGRVPWKVGRVLPNGELDRSFGVEGYLADGVSEVHRQVYTIVALPDGKILIGGLDYISIEGGRISEVGAFLARYDGSEARLPVIEHPAIQKAIQPVLPIKSKPVLPLWMKPKN